MHRHNVITDCFVALISITGWKTNLITRFEDRLLLRPLPLFYHPASTLPIKDFDYRRVTVTRHLHHNHELLIRPQLREATMVASSLRR